MVSWVGADAVGGVGSTVVSGVSWAGACAVGGRAAGDSPPQPESPASRSRVAIIDQIPRKYPGRAAGVDVRAMFSSTPCFTDSALK